MVFYNDLAGKNYARFIEYALKHSDSVMFMLDGYGCRCVEKESLLSEEEFLEQHSEFFITEEELQH